MLKLKKIVASTVLVSALIGVSASADEIVENSSSYLDNLYVGFQASETSGLSVKYALTDNIKAQVILGVIGDVNNYSARGLYSFSKGNGTDYYGYGSVGIAQWSNKYVDETVMSYGLGGGAEYDVRTFDKNFLPIFINAEAGLEYANFDNYNFGGIYIGLGVHYKF